MGHFVEREARAPSQVFFDGTPAEAAQFGKKFRLPHVQPDLGKSAAKKFDVTTCPSFVLVQGNVRTIYGNGKEIGKEALDRAVEHSRSRP